MESCWWRVAKRCQMPRPKRGARPVPCNARLATRMSIPFTEIAGQKLNSEQVAYLEGLFAGLKNRGLTFSDIEANPVGHSNGAAAGKKNLEALLFEKRIKQELHPLEAYPLLLEHAAANRSPDKENVFRFKWHGLFYLAPNKEAFMCRLRIPAGQVKSYQLRELARIAQELTTGYVQITTRANFQLRLIEPKDAPEVLRRISDGASDPRRRRGQHPEPDLQSHRGH